MIPDKDFVVHVRSPEESEKAQRYLFSKGFTWGGGSTRIENVNFPYLCIYPKGDRGKSDAIFRTRSGNHHNKPVLTLSELLEEEYKVGDYVIADSNTGRKKEFAIVAELRVEPNNSYYYRLRFWDVPRNKWVGEFYGNILTKATQEEMNKYLNSFKFKEPDMNFQVNDWVVFLPEVAKNFGLYTSHWNEERVLQISKIEEESKGRFILYFYNDSGSSNDAKCFRKATEKEIVTVLKPGTWVQVLDKGTSSAVNEGFYKIKKYLPGIIALDVSYASCVKLSNVRIATKSEVERLEKGEIVEKSNIVDKGSKASLVSLGDTIGIGRSWKAYEELYDGKIGELSYHYAVDPYNQTEFPNIPTLKKRKNKFHHLKIEI